MPAVALEDQTGPRGAGVGATTWRGKLYLIRAHVVLAWHHPANGGNRLRAVFRVLNFYGRGYLFHRRTLTPIGDSLKMWADTRVTSTARVVVGNPPDWRAMQAWKRILGPESLFVDVGANVGSYSLLAANLGATVIAAEPDREARAQLLENAELNHVVLEVHDQALADAPGVMRFTQGLGTMNHLLPADNSSGYEVTVTTLDAVLGDRKADGIKIDVEGAERLVLEGASRAMADGRLPVIQMEWNGMAMYSFGEDRNLLADLLHRHGYRLFQPDSDGRMQPFVEDPSNTEDVFAVLD